MGQLPKGSAKRFARQRKTESRLRLDAARDLEHNIATGRLKMPSLALDDPAPCQHEAQVTSPIVLALVDRP
jgi:hypothetical protein